MQKAQLVALLLLAFSGPAAAFDANGVALGASEAEVAKKFPGARCKPLEWKSDAADRRCDDAKVNFGGAEARITLYLRRDALQAFDVRFDTRDVPQVVAFLKGRWGAPAQEAHNAVERKPGDRREVHKVVWQKGKDRAELTSRAERSRAGVLAARGDFEQKIYEVK